MKKVFTLILALAFGFGLKAQCPLTVAVDFTATDCHGTEVHLFDILDGGQAVLIDFFFVNCGPCQQATPKVVESYYTMGCNMHDVFYMEISDRDSDAACQNWVTNYGVEYPTIGGPAGGAGICNTYQIGAFPTVILIMPDRSIVIQDLWPINNAQTVVTALGQHGVMPHDCNEPVGELTITPDTLWYSQMGEDQTFTILNETAETVTIEEVIPEEGSNLNIWEPLFPYTLEAGQSIDVLVGLQTPPAKVDFASYTINVLTSVGERQVVAMIPTAFDMGLLVPGSPYVLLNALEPSLDLYVMNGNAASLTPIEIISVTELIEGDPYLNIELGAELPLVLEASEEFHFTISPLYTGERSYANTIVELNYEGGTITFFVEIDGEILNITELNNGLKLYPNPANESLTLKGENLGMVRVFNVLGQKVDEFEANGDELRINTTSYENGVYVVKAGEQTLRFVVKH